MHKASKMGSPWRRRLAGQHPAPTHLDLLLDRRLGCCHRDDQAGIALRLQYPCCRPDLPGCKGVAEEGLQR